MSQATRFRSLVIFLSVTVSIFSLDTSASLGAGQEPSQDEARMRLEVSRYFESFAKKDLDSLLGHWSPSSPELDARKKELQQEFAANQNIEVKNFAIRKFIFEGDKASAQVTLEPTSKQVSLPPPSAK